MTEQDFQNNRLQSGNSSGGASDEQVKLRLSPEETNGKQAHLIGELRQVSPVLARLAQSTSQLSAEEWDHFADALAREINVATLPRRQTLKDRFSTSDNRFLRWLAVLVPAAR